MISSTISRAQLTTTTETIEDAIQAVCDGETLSGETAWKIISALAEAKLAELEGLTSD